MITPKDRKAIKRILENYTTDSTVKLIMHDINANLSGSYSSYFYNYDDCVAAMKRRKDLFPQYEDQITMRKVGSGANKGAWKLTYPRALYNEVH